MTSYAFPIAAKLFLARIGKPIGSLSIGSSLGNVLGINVGNFGTLTVPGLGTINLSGTGLISLPSGTSPVFSVKDLLDKVIQAGPRVVWQVWDLATNTQLTLPGGGVLPTLDLGVDLHGHFLIGAKLDDRPFLWFTTTIVQRIDLTRVTSDQIPGVPGSDLNAIPDQTLMCIAPRTDHLVHINVSASVSGSSQYASLVGVRAPIQGILGSAAIQSGAQTPVVFAAYSADFDVVAGVDLNGNGMLEANEIIEVFPNKIRVKNENDYTTASATLTGGSLTNIIFGHAAVMLGAFLNDSVPVGAASTNDGVLAPEDVTHRVGMRWLANATAETRRYTWTDGTSVSDQVEVNSALVAALRTAIGSHAAEVNAYFTQHPSENSHIFTWTYSQILDFDGLAMHYSFGHVVIEGFISPTVSRQNLAVTDVTYNGSLNDVYDFDITANFPAPQAAMVQMGFGSIGGNAGRVFRSRVEFENTLSGNVFAYQFPL